MTDYNFATHVQLQTEVEGLRGKPSERGQHEVVHGSRHDLTAHRALQVCHKVVDQEREVEQEHGRHKVDENLCGCTGLGPPVRNEHRGHTMFRKCTVQSLVKKALKQPGVGSNRLHVMDYVTRRQKKVTVFQCSYRKKKHTVRLIKGIVHPKMKIQSLATHPHAN